MKLQKNILKKKKRLLFTFNEHKKNKKETAMKKNKASVNHLANIKGRKIEFNFQGGNVTSDAGSLLLRQVDLKLGLTEQLANVIDDTRVQGQVTHSQLKMLRQRIFGLALGHEDVNDQDSLKKDIGFQTVIGEDEELASAPTISRFENRATAKWAFQAHEILVETFISSFKAPPEELVLDFDATDDAVHGKQDGKHFNAYYDHDCFLPLYVFCGEQLLVSYLSGSNTDGAKNSRTILSLLVRRFREIWPDVKITFRGDGGFCRPAFLRWCEKNGIQYIVGIGKNAVLKRKSQFYTDYSLAKFEETNEKQRIFGTFKYGAKSWKKERKIIAKAEHTLKGPNLRLIVTNLPGCGQELYDTIYCARGEMENRIKEQQLYLFADRTSCTKWYSNQFRLLLSSFAYVLLETIRRLALTGTELAKAQCSTIRLKLLKIGAVIIRNTRRVQFFMTTGYPYKRLFCRALEILSSA
jgi:hypothetical protein